MRRSSRALPHHATSRRKKVYLLTLRPPCYGLFASYTPHCRARSWRFGSLPCSPLALRSLSLEQARGRAVRMRGVAAAVALGRVARKLW